MAQPLVLTLQRDRRGVACTLGTLKIGAHTFQTLEHPWKDNAPRISCIPAGLYLCQPHGWATNSQVKFKRVWEVKNVKGRSAILIHAGNTVADILGCILVGMGRSGDSVTSSRQAIEFLRKAIGEQSFMLDIKDAK